MTAPITLITPVSTTHVYLASGLYIEITTDATGLAGPTHVLGRRPHRKPRPIGYQLRLF